MSTDLDSELELSESRAARGIYVVAGVSFVALGVLGVFLPLLPTTPFMLLAAACFARSSPRFYAWLVNHPTFGPSIRAWRAHRCIPVRAKRLAIFLIVVTFAISIGLVVSNLYLRLALAALAMVVITYIARIPSLESLETGASRE